MAIITIFNSFHSKFYTEYKLIHKCNSSFLYFEAFHDCVGPDGCDGCLNLNTPDNAGLGEIRKILVDERQKGFMVRTKQYLYTTEPSLLSFNFS